MKGLRVIWLCLAASFLWAAGAVLVVPAQAQGLKTYTKKAKFEDVKQDLTDAIVNKGLKIDYNGKIGDMLERTGADVGSSKPIYKGAEFVTFCSAKLSRAMMEADPLNIASCPYVMFVYESVAKPGEVVVGYRQTIARGSSASKKALAEIDKLLDAIAKETAK